MKVAILDTDLRVLEIKVEDAGYQIQAPQEYDVTSVNPLPKVGEFFIAGKVITPVEIITVAKGFVVDISTVPSLPEYLTDLGENKFVMPNVDPKPAVGWKLKATGFEPNTKIHKSFFIARLQPWWQEIQETRKVDPVVDNYFEMFKHFTHVDFTYPPTVAMVNDLIARVKITYPELDISWEALSAPVTPLEAY